MLSAFSQAWDSWKSARAVARSRWSRLPSASARPRRSSPSSTASCCGRCLTRTASASSRSTARRSASPARSADPVPDLQDYQQQTQSFDVFGWFRPASFNLTFARPAAARRRHRGDAVARWRLGVARSSGNGSTTISARSFRARCGGGSAPWPTSSAAHHARRPQLHGHRRDAAGVPAAGARTRGRTRRDRRVDCPRPAGRGQSRSTGAYFCYARMKPGVSLGAGGGRRQTGRRRHRRARSRRRIPSTRRASTICASRCS